MRPLSHEFALAAALTIYFAAPLVHGATVTFLDDAERIHRTAALPKSVFTEEAVAIDAMLGDVVSFQIVIDGAPARQELSVSLEGALDSKQALPSEKTLPAKYGSRGGVHLFRKGESELPVDATFFSEAFIDVKRRSGNEREDEALAFAHEAKPRDERLKGEIADPLLPGNIQNVPESSRAAFWVDLRPVQAFSSEVLPEGGVDAGSVATTRLTPSGTYASKILIKAGGEVLATRAVHLRFHQRELPYPRGRAFAYFDVDTLQARGFHGSEALHYGPRRILKEHGIEGVTELTPLTAVNGGASSDAYLAEVDALRGRFDSLKQGGLPTHAGRAPNGNRSPSAGASTFLGDGEPNRTLIFGIYGSLKDPDVEKARALRELAERLRKDANGTSLGETRPFDAATPFIYAIDEVCDSPRIVGWKRALDEAFRELPDLRKTLHVGVTCSKPARQQPADIVFMTTDAYAPERDAPTATQFVGVYNGRRPHAGAPVLDVPATDLLANGWILAKYNLWKWFYWESTFWLDGNRGGKGGKDGFDPFVVAETFHNADGDYQNGDGILLYPGKQPSGMTNYGVDELFPSIRLKMIRRGLLDSELIRLAREKDAATTNAIVDTMVPIALADAQGAASWPERGADWFFAREALHRIVRGEPAAFTRTEPRLPASSSRALLSKKRGKLIVGALAFLAIIGLGALLARRRS